MSSTAARANEPRTILIVEDDPCAFETFEHILTHNGYAVRVASSAELGWINIQDLVPAAVLVDLHLPMASGLEFLRQLRANPPYATIPIAIVTGDYFVDEDVGQELEALGARVHLKPLWEEDLLILVHELLDG